MINCIWLLSSFFLTRTYRSFAAWPKIYLLSMDKERFLQFSDSAVGLNLLEQLFFWTWDFPGQTSSVSYLISLQQALGIVFFSLAVLLSFFLKGKRSLFAWSRELRFFSVTHLNNVLWQGISHRFTEQWKKLWVLKGWRLGAGKAGGNRQRVRGLRSISGQSRAFCCWELLLLPSSRSCGMSLPGMMLIGQAAWIGDAFTAIALSFVSRDIGEREVVSVIHKLQCGLLLLVELCGALGEYSKWAVCQGAGGMGKAQRTTVVPLGIQRFFFPLPCMTTILVLESMVPKIICTVYVSQVWIEDHAHCPSTSCWLRVQA